MATKVSLIVPARDKAARVGATVDSVLAQTLSPLEIVLSDQGSTDGTLDILRAKAAAYDGPNHVRVLRCPDTEYRGMPGLNAHLNWLHRQIDGELVIMCSADDLIHPERAARTLEAYETAYLSHPDPAIRENTAYRPSYVCTHLDLRHPDGAFFGEVDFPDRRSRWIEPEEAFRWQICSSGSSSWARDLYERHGPLVKTEGQDIVLPAMGLMERGLYYLNETLHTYIIWADRNNMGIEGILRATEEHSDEWFSVAEMNAWSNVAGWCAVARRFQAAGFTQRLTQGAQQALFEKISQNANFWSLFRDHITVSRINPRNMVV